MTINKENVVEAYNVADDNGKKMLEALFGADTFTRPDNRSIEERIKTFDDAVKELGYEHPLVRTYLSVINECKDIDERLDAYLQLRIICAALNEGWEPKFTENEWRYHPWFCLYTGKEIAEKKDIRLIVISDRYETEYEGFGYACPFNIPSNAAAVSDASLCLKDALLAAYCGKQFIDIWADYLLIRK